MRSHARLSRRLIPALVVLLAAALRFWDLGVVPPGFQFDEAHNAIDAARVLAGEFQLFFTENGGREPLVTYLHATTLGLLGRANVVMALRLVSAFVGIATVAVMYGFGRRFTGSRLVGTLAAALLAINYWHLHFSRYAIRAILAPLLTAGVLWAWWIAIGGAVHEEDAGGQSSRPGGSRSRILAAVICGVLLAVAVYSHPSGRLLPFVLLGHAIYRALLTRASARATWRALVVVGVVAIVVFLPLGNYFVQHPEQFLGHPSDVSLAKVAEADYGGSMPRAFAANLAATAGMFFVRGDPSTFHNLPDLPVFDPLSALFAVIGAGVVLGWLFGSRSSRRDRAILIVMWLAVGLLPTLLSDRPPNYSRAMAALPAIVLVPAFGLAWSMELLDRHRPALRSVMAVGVIVMAALWTTYHYFVTFSHLPHAYYSYDVEKVDAYRALEAMTDDATVFLHPLWSRHATIRFLNDDGAIKTLDGRDTVVFPADRRDVVVTFPAKEAEREGWLEQARSYFGRSADETTMLDAKGAPVLRVLRYDGDITVQSSSPDNFPLVPTTVDGSVFGDRIEFVGYSWGGAVPGAPLPIVLVWRALADIDRDLTVFTHIVDAEGQSKGQMDREPGHASYRTSHWSPGDVVVDRYMPVLEEGASGELFVRLGWYDRETGQRLTLDDGEDSVLLGPVGADDPVNAQQ